MLQKLQFKPGINREVSNYTNEGGWYDSDKIRFKSGYPEQIGGWTRVSSSQYLGIARGLINWIALDGDNLTGVGTSKKYYVEEGGTFYDITPIRASNANTTTFSATNSSAVITATDSSGHGAAVGDSVLITNAVSLGGLITATVLNTEHVITSVPSSTVYTFTASATANASDSGNGGSATDASYLIGVGPSEFSFVAGWGSGTWPDFVDVTLGTDPFNVSAGSATVTVTHTGHGLDTGDYIYINSIGTSFALSGTDGRTAFACTDIMLTAFQITKINTDSYTISLVINGITYDPDSSDSSAGGTVSIRKKNTTTSTWGTTVVADLASQLRLWTHDSFGEDLVFGEYQGGIFYWDKSDGTSARGETLHNQTSGATGFDAAYIPRTATAVLVADQSRHVVCLGTDRFGGAGGGFDALQIRWSASEDLAMWVPRTDNTAGDYRLDNGSQIVTAIQTRQEILIFTDTAIYSMQFVGLPYVFTFNLLATNISIVSPNSVITANNLVFWMGHDKFYVYDGQVRALPSTLRSYVYDGMNKNQEFQIFAGGNEGFNEAWWFYCSSGSNSIDSYVIYNYLENLWYFGSMARSAWLDSGSKSNPIAADYNNRLLYHEVGTDDISGTSATSLSSYIESSDFDIGDGDRFGYVSRLIPDLTFSGSTATNPEVSLTLTPRNFSGASYTTETAKSVSATALSPTELYTDVLDVRIRGRQMKFKVDGSSSVGTKWQLGTPRMDIRTDGKR